MAAKCQACEERGKPWNGSDPRCAFEEDLFSRANWNCATVNKIRDICYEGQESMPGGVDYQYCDDQKYATINVSEIELPGSPLALWVSWYKNRGATDGMWLLFDNHPPKRPTESDLLKIAESIV